MSWVVFMRSVNHSDSATHFPFEQIKCLLKTVPGSVGFLGKSNTSQVLEFIRRCTKDSCRDFQCAALWAWEKRSEESPSGSGARQCSATTGDMEQIVRSFGWKSSSHRRCHSTVRHAAAALNLDNAPPLQQVRGCVGFFRPSPTTMGPNKEFTDLPWSCF